jgi:hypothetical protein
MNEKKNIDVKKLKEQKKQKLNKIVTKNETTKV